MDLRLIWFENESIYHINHQIKLGNALLESLSEQSQNLILHTNNVKKKKPENYES